MKKALDIPNRLDELEGMRGIAALVVYIHHFLLLIYPSFYFLDPVINNDYFLIQWLAKTPLGILNDGHIPVRFFFVHSGFVLTYAFIKSGALGKYNYIKIFSAILRRYFRLTGPVLASILLGYLFMKFSWMHNKTVDELHVKRWISSYYQFQPDFWKAIYQGVWGTYFEFKSSRTYNSSLWTIAIELKASFLIYAMACLGSFLKLPLRIILYIVPLYFFGVHSSYACFIFGLIMCELYMFKGQLKINNKFVLWSLLILAIYFGGIKTFDHPLYSWIPLLGVKSKYFFYSFKTLGSMFLILFVLNSVNFKAFLKSNPIHYLGKLSYSLYVIHFILLASLSSFLLLNGVAHLINFAITTVVLFILSYLMYRFVDTPSMIYPKKIVKKLVGRFLIDK